MLQILLSHVEFVKHDSLCCGRLGSNLFCLQICAFCLQLSKLLQLKQSNRHYHYHSHR